MACYFTIHGWPISDCTAEGVKTVVCYHLYHVLTSKKNDISYFGNIIAPPPPHPLSLPPSLSLSHTLQACSASTPEYEYIYIYIYI